MENAEALHEVRLWSLANDGVCAAFEYLEPE